MAPHPDHPHGAPDWWLPLPADTRHVARVTTGMRLVELLEYGFDLRARCLLCNEHTLLSYNELTGAFQRYLNATVRQLQPRLKCRQCGGQDHQLYETNGCFRAGGMVHAEGERRQLWIRATLRGLGLDPLDYGYAPLAVEAAAPTGTTAP